MRHHYNVFEKFPDGSSIWRGYLSGWYLAQLRMYELAEQSKNEFYAIDIEANSPVTPSVKSASLPTAKARQTDNVRLPFDTPNVSKYLEASREPQNSLRVVLPPGLGCASASLIKR